MIMLVIYRFASRAFGVRLCAEHRKETSKNMQWTSLNDLREKYLSFFESKGHLRLPSYSLIPNNDKSLLLINSGMAPMKKFFTGEEEPPVTELPPAKNVSVPPTLRE